MNLKLECDASAVGAEETYQSLLSHIEGLASARSGAIDDHSAWRGLKTRNPQVLSIARSGLFDGDLYLRTYPDVAAAGLDPLLHYIEGGDEEGRWPNAYFDPIYYRRQFNAVGRWPVTTLHHYITQGEAAGLRPCAAFDASRYLDGAGIGPWVDRPLAHFLWIGRHHGLSPNPRSRRLKHENIDIAPPRMPKPVRTTGLMRAVNLIGPLDRVGGVGVSARGYLEGMVRSGFGPVGTIARRPEFNAQARRKPDHPLASPVPNAAINLVHMGPDTLPRFLNSPDRRLLDARYNIAVWYWELPTLRPEWWEMADHFHAFWAPTDFVARALRQITTKPVHLLPPFLGEHLTAWAKSPLTSPVPSFVYCFDANSLIHRKNPEVLVDAFLEAFPEAGEARLILKITHPNRQPELARIYGAAARRPDIELIDRLLSDAELSQLVGSATAYVSPHRSEGLGLTVVEAMAAGVSVIATPFGGVASFVSEATSWPLDYQLVELTQDHGPYPRGYVWAEPEPRSLVNAMRQVLAAPEEASARANAARETVREQFCSEALIGRYRAALESAARSIGL